MTDHTPEYQPRTRKAAFDDTPAEKIDPRRPAPGVRRASDFFDPDHQRRELLRGEYVNVRASEEYARRESTYWRRFLRLVRGQPQVVDFNARLADSHARTLETVKQDLLEKRAKMEDELARRRQADTTARARESTRDE